LRSSREQETAELEDALRIEDSPGPANAAEAWATDEIPDLRNGCGHRHPKFTGWIRCVTE
jgi:hypothetical protein